MKTAFVTGSHGFVARHLCPKLRESGYFVIGVDPAGPDGPYEGGINVCYPWRGLTSLDGTVCVGSKETARETTPDYESYEYAPEHTYRPDLAIHLAANIQSVDKRISGGLDAYQDVAQDFEFLKWCEAANPGRVVLMSSCAVDAEDDPYGFCKVALEKFAARLSVPHVILRPFSGYSHTQSLSYPFPALWKQVMERCDPVTVWGDLATVRDWLHVEDLVRAILWAATKAPTNGVPIEIGTGVGTCFRDLVQMMASAVGYKPRIVADTSKPSSTPSRIANIELAAQHGFKARISVSEGIERSLDALRRSDPARKESLW